MIWNVEGNFLNDIYYKEDEYYEDDDYEYDDSDDEELNKLSPLGIDPPVSVNIRIIQGLLKIWTEYSN